MNVFYTLGFAYWLVPSEPECSTLHTIIQNLASSEPNSPIFLPHITLFHPIAPLTNLSDLSTVKRVIKSIRHSLVDLSLDLKPAESGTAYYQSLLAPVKPIPVLLELRKAFEEEFEYHSDTVYFPHLSLLYGDLSQPRRDELAEKVNGSQEPSLPRCVTVKDVVVVEFGGPVETWKELARVSLE